MAGYDNAPASSESAPSYDDLFADHPVNRQPPSGSSKSYAPVAQEEVSEQQQDQHHCHGDSDPENDAAPLEMPLQELTGGAKPHVHCEACDKIAERRERRLSERHCCGMVALTFIAAFVCLTIAVATIMANLKH